MSTRKVPLRIPDTPENIALECMQGPPEKGLGLFEERTETGGERRPKDSAAVR